MMKNIAILILWITGSALSVGSSEIMALSVEPPQELLKKCDSYLLVPASYVVGKIKDNDKIILVDIRQKDDFEKIRIPGSLNIPLHTLKTKEFLKGKELILVGEGYQCARLEQECGKLRQSGFNVWILNGGLHYWNMSGGTLEEIVFTEIHLNRIAPLKFLYEKDSGQWIIVDVSREKRSGNDSLFSRYVLIPFADNEKSFASHFEACLTKEKFNPCTKILVFNEKGDQYDKIEAILQKTSMNKVFFLDGGIQSYRKAVELQNTIGRGPPHFGKSSSQKCGSCR